MLGDLRQKSPVWKMRQAGQRRYLICFQDIIKAGNFTVMLGKRSFGKQFMCPVVCPCILFQLFCEGSPWPRCRSGLESRTWLLTRIKSGCRLFNSIRLLFTYLKNSQHCCWFSTRPTAFERCCWIPTSVRLAWHAALPLGPHIFWCEEVWNDPCLSIWVIQQSFPHGTSSRAISAMGKQGIICFIHFCHKDFDAG